MMNLSQNYCWSINVLPNLFYQIGLLVALARACSCTITIWLRLYFAYFTIDREVTKSCPFSSDLIHHMAHKQRIITMHRITRYALVHGGRNSQVGGGTVVVPTRPCRITVSGVRGKSSACPSFRETTVPGLSSTAPGSRSRSHWHLDPSRSADAGRLLHRVYAIRNPAAKLPPLSSKA
jgi:hypothetical protein